MNKSTIDATEPARDFVSASAFDPHDTADIRYFNNLLAGRYSVLRLLASGEDSSHYLARTAEHNLLVELELLSDEAARDGSKVEMFCSEAQAAARLSHKNIVSASLDRRVDPAYVIVSRYNSGLVTLRDLLDRKSVLDVRQAVELAREISSALDYAHQLGVLHLQLSPQKVLLGADGTVLVTGFGIDARYEFDWAHKERSYRCPVQYRSPEQLSGARVDHRTDLYCLGILLYEMLTDRVPFNSSDTEYIKRKRIAQTPWPPHRLRQSLPEPLSKLVLELLRNNPDERINSAGRFLSALDDLINTGQAIEVESPVEAAAETQQGYDSQSSNSGGLVIVDPADTDSSASAVLLPEIQPTDASAEDSSQDDLRLNSVAAEITEKPRNAQAEIHRPTSEVRRDPVVSEDESKRSTAMPLSKSTSPRRVAFIVALIACIAALSVFIYRGGLNNLPKHTKRAVIVNESGDQPAPVLEGSGEAESPATPEPAGETDDNRQASKKVGQRSGPRLTSPSTPEEKAEVTEEAKPSSTVLVVPMTSNKSASIVVDSDRNGGGIVVRSGKADNETSKATEKLETANRATTGSSPDRKAAPSQRQKDNSNINPR